MKADQKAILLLAFVLEGALFAVFLIWAHFRGFEMELLPGTSEVFWGVVLALFLCAMNYLIVYLAALRIDRFRSFSEFVDTVVKPLADSLDWKAALVVSILAGVAEELFFRAMLQGELGIVAASVLFSLLHFGPAVRDYPLVAVWYLIIGFYFGLIYQWFGTIWVPIVIHTLYDFLALLWLKHCYRGGSEQ